MVGFEIRWLSMLWAGATPQAVLCIMRHEEHYHIYIYRGRVNSYVRFDCQLSYTATCQLRCILSARLHRVFGCDLSVDSQLQCDLSAVPVDCVDNSSQLG